MCAPNDVWSLGVILVNLTCGRNPWKQASFQDSTYRAYVRSQDFLKTILPLTDELNDILGRIFNPNPEHRVTLSELRNRIIACSQFTVPAVPTMTLPTPTSTQDQYVSNEDAIVDDYDCDSPLSPVSTSSNEGSLISSVSTLDDFDNDDEDEDFMADQQDLPREYIPQTYEPEEFCEQQQPVYHGHEFVPQQYTGPVPVPVLHAPIVPVPVVAAPIQHMSCQQVPVPIQAPIPVQPACQPKSFFPLWEVVKYVQQVPMMQHPVPFHQQVSFLSSLPGCY